ncbi:MAG: hypothetical protein IKR25_02425 [Muribaculaceae bacterium]|nr:hypothetical protein [Muribaculaceae bacterium]
MAQGNSVFTVVRTIFGILMIVIYFGMAYAMAVNFFNLEINPYLRWGMAVILALYGVYRCYRQVKGIDYYGRR